MTTRGYSILADLEKLIADNFEFVKRMIDEIRRENYIRHIAVEAASRIDEPRPFPPIHISDIKNPEIFYLTPCVIVDGLVVSKSFANWLHSEKD